MKPILYAKLLIILGVHNLSNKRFCEQLNEQCGFTQK